MKHHIFVFPSSYTALIYVIIVSTGLLLSLFVGLWMHPDELLFTHCRVEEYWPSISTLTGDFQPERQIWRSAFVLCAPFRLGATISLFALFWERACGDMKDLRGMVRSPMTLFKSSTALTLVMFFCDLLRLIGALAWTMIASSEDLGRHNLGFAFYILMGFFMQLLIDIIVRRNIYNLAMYASVEEARLSARLKRCFLIGQTTSAVCLVLFYVRHLATCAPGAYSLSTMCEWLFAVFNICFDASTWLELKKSRWTFGSTPENYKEFLSKNMKEQKTEKQHNNVERGPEEYHPMITGVAVSSEDYSESGTTGVVVHEFTFCCPPSDTAMWLVDTYWAYMFWEMIVHVVQHMYFMPLVAMSISFELLGMLAFCSPVLLIFSPFRRWALGTIPFPKIFLRGGGGENGGIQGRKVPMYILFYLMTSFSHIHVHVRNSERLKLLMTMVGPFFVSLATFCRFLYPSTPTVDTIDASCRMLYTFPLGLVVTMLVRVLYISQDPVFTDAVYAGLFGIVLGITCTTVLYRYVMYSEDASTGDEFEEVDNNNNSSSSSSNNNNNNKNNYYNGNNNANGDQDRHVHFSRTRETNVITTLALAYKPFSPTIMGLVFGALSIISLTFYTCANYIPRLMAVDPYPANLLVVLCFVLGLYYSQDIVSLVTPSKRDLFLWGRLGAGLLGGCLLLLFATRQTNRSYELRHPHYPTTMESLKENVDIRFWAVEEDFAGNKYVAFCGGLIMTVCFGALYPVVMELVFVNQRARRLAYVNTGKLEDSHGSQTFKQLHVSSFELVWATTTIVGLVLFALCISYPFVPMAWLIRERSVSMHFGVMAAVFVLTFFMSRRVKNAVLVTGKDPNSTRKQRRMPFVIFIFICFAFFAVVVGRFTLAPADRSIREGNDAARRFPSEVVAVHKALLRLEVEKNKITDPLLEDYEIAFIDKRYESKMWELNDEVLWEEQSESKIVANAPRGKFGLALQHLSPEEKMQVWEAAKGMTFFSGMIWTVHFALDNRNTDSLSRMAKQVELTGAGVIGILESDTMHLTNGNRDIVEFLSYSLGYRYTSYGPTALDNTYGCALISKYPITSVRRYTMPSPQGELSCLIHAQLDVFGLRVHAYVSHFGNTEHWGDGLLQSQFLARVVKANPGPSVFLGYIVSYPGNPERYEYYASQSKKGYMRDAALVLYRNRSWERLWDRGGYDEPPPERTTPPPGEPLDFNVEWKLEKAAHLEAGMTPDVSFRRTPPDRPPRYFRHNTAQRITTYHPRMEFIDRYCEYIFYKTGATKDENPADADKLQPLQMYLFDWWRVLDGESLTLSDTEIQVVQLGFRLRR